MTKPKDPVESPLKIGRDQENAADFLATQLESISKEVRILLSGKLRRKTLLVLLSHQTKIPMRQIDVVLSALETMNIEWIKP